MNEPNTPTPDKEAFDAILTAIRAEGGATAENLILATLGYVSCSLDRLQETLPGGNNLQLTAEQLRILHYVAMDIHIAGARFTAKLVQAGEDVSQWAALSPEESHAMTHQQLLSMFRPRDGAPASESPKPQGK